MCCSEWVVPARNGAEAAEDSVHPPSDTGAGERVPFQSLPDEEKTDRDRSHTLPFRKTNQNLVPKPENEVEKRQQVAEHEERPKKERTVGSTGEETSI